MQPQLPAVQVFADRPIAEDIDGWQLQFHHLLSLVDEAVEGGLKLLSEDTEDLFSSVTQNIFDRPMTPNLHLKTVFDKIPESALPQIRKWLLTEGSSFHTKVRDKLSKYDLDTAGSTGSQKEPLFRVVLAAFSSIVELKNKRRDEK